MSEERANGHEGKVKELPGSSLTGRYIEDATVRELEQSVRFRSQLSNAGAWVIDIPSNTIVWSESTFRTLGKPLPAGGAPHVMGFEQWVHPDDLARVAEELTEPFTVPSRFSISVRAIGQDGTTRFIRAIGESYKTSEDITRPDRGFGVLLDVTDQVLSARTLEMALAIDRVFTGNQAYYAETIASIVHALTEVGGFSYAAYHEGGSAGVRTTAFSGSNRFMATEELRRVQEVLESGKPSQLTDSNNRRGTILAVFLPVKFAGKTQGALAVWSEEPGEFSDLTTKYLENLSKNMGFLGDKFAAVENTNNILRTLTTMFGAAIESHTPFDAGRHPRIAALSRAIADYLGMSPKDAFGVEIAASIYDMGMLWITGRVTMAQPVTLTEEEKIDARRHTVIGESIASAFDWPWPVSDVMGQHHEHWDGSGYPRGVSGEEIALAARIVAVAAAYEGLMRERPYQPVLSSADAVGSIAVRAGTHFDPGVVDALEAIIAEGFTFASPHPRQSLARDHDTSETQVRDR